MSPRSGSIRWNTRGQLGSASLQCRSIAQLQPPGRFLPLDSSRSSFPHLFFARANTLMVTDYSDPSLTERAAPGRYFANHSIHNSTSTTPIACRPRHKAAKPISKLPDLPQVSLEASFAVGTWTVAEQEAWPSFRAATPPNGPSQRQQGSPVTTAADQPNQAPRKHWCRVAGCRKVAAVASRQSARPRKPVTLKPACRVCASSENPQRCRGMGIIVDGLLEPNPAQLLLH